MRGGSLDGAADLLGVNHSTVYRRITKIERECGRRLFDRNGATYVPTSWAKFVLPLAERMEEDALALRRAMSARSESLTGRIRVTMPVPMLPLVRRSIANFRRLHPGVTVSLLVDGELHDLDRGDADVAIRCTADPDGDLIGHRVSPVAWALYARAGVHPDELPFAVYDPSFRRLPAVQWRRKHYPDAREAYEVDSPATMRRVLVADDVAGLLMCYAGDTEPMLRRVSPVSVHGSVWVLYAPALRKSPQVRAFSDTLISALAMRRPLISGEQPIPW